MGLPSLKRIFLLKGLQEVLIVAYFAAVLFQMIRDDLLHDDGIPFGIATSGFSFDRSRYFWSPALCGFRTSSKSRRVLLLCVIALVGFIALVAGAVSAVILLPRITVRPITSAKNSHTAESNSCQGKVICSTVLQVLSLVNLY